MKKVTYLLLILFFAYSCSSDSADEPEEMMEEQMMEEEQMEEEEESEVVCNLPSNIFIESITQNSADLFWDPGQGALMTRIEYGLEGFTVGSGQVVTNESSFVTLEDLLPETLYDVYFISNCESGTNSELVGPFQFETLPVCVAPLSFNLLATQSTSIFVDWQPFQDTTAWELEYGLVGFELGTGTVVQTSDMFFQINALVPSTTYEIYIRTNCGSDGFSEYLDPIVATTDGFGDLFTGQYMITQNPNTMSEVLFGENVFGIDGQNGVVVSLFGPDQAPSQTTEGVSVSDTQRAFDSNYGGAIGTGTTLTYILDFSNGQVILSQDEETSLACSGNLLLIGEPVSTPGSYENDNQFTFVFQEDVLNSCGNPVDIILNFTKI